MCAAMQIDALLMGCRFRIYFLESWKQESFIKFFDKRIERCIVQILLLLGGKMSLTKKFWYSKLFQKTIESSQNFQPTQGKFALF